MSDIAKYNDAQRTNGVNAVHRAYRALKEHWEFVEINVNASGDEGHTQYSLESDDDDDDEDKAT